MFPNFIFISLYNLDTKYYFRRDPYFLNFVTLT